MPPTAIPARIADVRRTPAGRHVVVLAAAGDELPILVGAPEAGALVGEIEDVELPRQSAHAVAADVPIEVERDVLAATRGAPPRSTPTTWRAPRRTARRASRPSCAPTSPPARPSSSVCAARPAG